MGDGDYVLGGAGGTERVRDFPGGLEVWAVGVWTGPEIEVPAGDGTTFLD